MRRLILIILFLFIAFLGFSQQDSWHYYQLDYYGLGNCGPACVAMAYTYKSGYFIHIDYINWLIGYNRLKDGATTLYILSNVMNIIGLNHKVVEFNSLKTFTFEENFYILSINTRYISNKDYEYNDGHYIIIFDHKDGFYKIADPLSKKEFVWYNEKDLERAKRNSYAIAIEKGRGIF